jgi:tetrahydromethanopterin S-methyltransferase subunit F
MRMPLHEEASQIARIATQKEDAADRWDLNRDPNLRIYASIMITALVTCVTGMVVSGVLLWRVFA